MGGYILSPEPSEDLFQIWSYLAATAGTQIAGEVEAELFEKFDLLAQNSGLGHKREDPTKFPVLFYRAFPYEYLIVYRNRVPLEVVGVLHGRRNVKRLLKKRGE